MQNAKKRLSAVMAFVIALCFAMSVLFIVSEAEHKCSGDDCQVCQTVNACLNLLDNTTPKPENASFVAALVFAIVLVLGAVCSSVTNNSLTALKVKLSN